MNLDESALKIYMYIYKSEMKMGKLILGARCGDGI